MVVAKTYCSQDLDGMDDNIFHQTQRMFGFLDITDRQAYDPTTFCFSFKDWDNNPVNVAIQQDTQEFLQRFFDKLETALKETPFNSILQGIYGGKKLYKTTCQNCKVVTNREELFYNMSLKVKNFKTVYEAMQDDYMRIETISDYKCDKCLKKVDITRQCSLHKLPNVFIFHL